MGRFNTGETAAPEINQERAQETPVRVTQTRVTQNRTESSTSSVIEDARKKVRARIEERQTQATRRRSSMFSIRGAVAGGSDAIGDWTELLVIKYANFIDEALGSEPPAAEMMGHLKLIKIPIPETKYGGEDDLEVFDTWIRNLINWFQTYMLTGDSRDSQRIAILPSCLKDDAFDYVESLKRSEEFNLDELIFDDVPTVQSFTGMISSLIRRFITRASATMATERFRDATMKSDEGIVQFATRVVKLSQRMVNRPDVSTMNHQILFGVPDRLRREAIRMYSISPEASTVKEVVDALKKVEESQINTRAIEKAMAQRGNNRLTTRIVNPTPRETNYAPRTRNTDPRNRPN